MADIAAASVLFSLAAAPAAMLASACAGLPEGARGGRLWPAALAVPGAFLVFLAELGGRGAGWGFLAALLLPALAGWIVRPSGSCREGEAAAVRIWIPWILRLWLAALAASSIPIEILRLAPSGFDLGGLPASARGWVPWFAHIGSGICLILSASASAVFLSKRKKQKDKAKIREPMLVGERER